jgi:Overcoming lysogenization defect protein-like, TOPRIM domain
MRRNALDRARIVGIVHIARRRDLASELLDGYVYGPAAATEATARALAKAQTAIAVMLVEGISDQMAIETLAVRRGRDLAAEGVVVVPVGGAHAVTRYLSMFGPAGAGLELSGLCDLGEEHVFRRGLNRAGIGAPRTRQDMERLGFYVCVEDLEDELIRAIGDVGVEALIESQGDLGSLRSLQRQPPWRGQPTRAQLRRFLSSGSTRKLRYALLLAGAVDLQWLPHPLDALLATPHGS